jgi:hypothetical protein
MKEYGVKYREENKKEIKEKNKEYREENKEKVKEDDSLRYYANPEPKKQAAKERYAANPEAKKAYDKEFRKTDAGKKISRKAAWKNEELNLIIKKNLTQYIKYILKLNFVIFVIVNYTKVM